MAARRSSRRADAAGIALAAISIVVAVGVGSYIYLNRPPKISADLCAADGPSGIVAIAVDATDQLGEAQRLTVKSRLIAAADDMPEATRIELWTVAPTSGVPERVGKVFCRPTPADKVNSVTGNPKKAAEGEAVFRRELGAALDSVLAKASSSASPILETLQAIDIRSFSTLELRRVAVKRVILVSDLIQNTRAISLLTALPEPEPPKGMAVSLTGVEIDVEFIDRTPSAYGEGALMEWWQELLRRCGAQLRKVRRV